MGKNESNWQGNQGRNPHLDNGGVPGNGVPSILDGTPPGHWDDQGSGVGPGGVPGLLDGTPPGHYEPETEPADFQVTAFEAPESAELNEDISDDLTGTVENQGDETATKDIEVRLDGGTLYSASEELGAGEEYDLAEDLEEGDVVIPEDAGTEDQDITLWTEDSEMTETIAIEEDPYLEDLEFTETTGSEDAEDHVYEASELSMAFSSEDKLPEEDELDLDAFAIEVTDAQGNTEEIGIDSAEVDSADLTLNFADEFSLEWDNSEYVMSKGDWDLSADSLEDFGVAVDYEDGNLSDQDNFNKEVDFQGIAEDFEEILVA